MKLLKSRTPVNAEAPAPVDDVATRDAAVAACRADGLAAHDEIERHEHAKLNATTVEQFVAANAGIAAAKARAEFAARQLPGLQQRLAAAQARVSKEAESFLVFQYQAVFSDYCKAMESCLVAAEAAEKIRSRAVTTIGLGRTDVLLPVFVYAGILHAGFIRDWITRNKKDLTAAANVDAPPLPTIFAPPPRIVRRPQPSANRVIDEGSSGTAAVLPDYVGPILSDHVLAQVLRAGYPDSSGRHSQRGRKILLTKDVARDAQRNGAIEVIDAGITGLPVGAHIGLIGEFPTGAGIDPVRIAVQP
jgi:hypothetical protein